MNVPPAIFWEVLILVFGFILGTLWGHHAAIGKRVTYAECSQKRKDCPCMKDIEELKEEIKEKDN